MICPKCKCEYREGFSTCADCQIPLVAAVSSNDDSGLIVQDSVAVFATTDPIQANMVRGFLNAQDIDADLDDNSGYPGIRVRVMVPVSQQKNAEELIRQHSENSQNEEIETSSDKQTGVPQKKPVKSQRLDVCPRCKTKCEIDSNYCDRCGQSLEIEDEPNLHPERLIVAPPIKTISPNPIVQSSNSIGVVAILIWIGIGLLVFSFLRLKNSLEHSRNLTFQWFVK